MEESAKYELVKPKSGEALVEVEQQRAVAETQSAMIIAKRFPRDPIAAMDKIVNACTRPGLAEAALYEYSRGGTAITGPSIRLAEAIAQAWGNLQFGVRELEQRNGASTVEAFAWDIETNTRQIKVFQVPHKRYTKQGTYALSDPRDVYEIVANQAARRLRSCILGVIPGDVVESAVTQCETTLKTKAAVTPERIASLIDKFGEFKVTKDQIEKRIQRHLDAITPAQIVNLAKIYNSLKDGMSSAADWFEVEDKTEEAKDRVESLKDKLRAEPKPEPQAPAEVAATAQEEAPTPVEPKKSQKKSLFSQLQDARGQFFKLVMDNLDAIKDFLPDELKVVKDKWERGSKGGRGGIPIGLPWPLNVKTFEDEPKGPPPMVDFETGEIAESEGPLTPTGLFIEEAERYRELLDVSTWDAILGLYQWRGKDLDTLQPGYHQAFLQRCKAQLDLQNANK